MIPHVGPDALRKLAKSFADEDCLVKNQVRSGPVRSGPLQCLAVQCRTVCSPSAVARDPSGYTYPRAQPARCRRECLCLFCHY